MTVAAFPTELGTFSLNYAETVRASVLDSEMETGYGRIQFRGHRPPIMSGSFRPFTAAELAVFEAFIQTTLVYVSKFTIAHPRLSTIITVRIQFNGDSPYTIAAVGGGLYQVSWSVKVLS